MPDSKAINNPFLDDQNINNASEPGGSKFDPSTAKPVVNTIPTLKDKNSKFDPSTAKAVDKGFGGHVRDLGASLMGGLAAVPDVVVGVADLYTSGRAGKAVDNLSDNFKLGEGQKYWQDQKTDHAKVQSKEFDDAEGIVDKTKVALSNPSMITNTVVESLPSMALGGLAGRGLNVASKGLINPVAAGAASEGLVMAGAQAEQIRQETDDGLLTGKQVAAAAGTGVAGGLLGFLGGTVAKKLGFEDVDTLMARGVRPEQVAGEISQIPFSSIPKSIVLGAISEGLLEEMPQSVTEQVLQNYALDKDLFEGVDDAIVMGTLAGMAMGGTVAGTSQASKWAGQPNTGNPEASDDTDTTGSTPMLPAPTGGNGGAPGLSYDGLQGEYIPAGQQGTTEQTQARQNFEYDQMSTDADNLINYGGQSPQSAPNPSEQMGLDPNLGPLSAAAATAVDSGMSQQMQIEMQAQSAAESTSKSTEKTTDSNTPLQQAADAVRDLTPEQIHGKQSTYGSEVTTAIEKLKQRQQGEQNAPVTDIGRTQNEAVQSGNASIDNGSQPFSEQHDTAATSAMGTETGAAQKGLQPAQSDAGQVTQSTRPNLGGVEKAPTQSLNEIQSSDSNIQTDNKQSKVSELEAQLVTEKSVPKKAKIRKQIAELQQGLADQTQSEANINGPQKATVDNLRDDFAKMDRATTKVNAIRQRMRAENPDIFTEANDRVRETHGLTNARVSAIADEIESSGSYELSDREYDKVKNNPNYKIDYNPKTFIGKVTAVKDQHSGEWVGNSEQSNGQSTAQINAGQVTQNEIQTSNNQTRVSELEAQLATEKSVPKKAQLRKQLENLNAERTAIIEKNKLVPIQESSLREGTQNNPNTTSSFQTQPLDHGALNVPLSKRGNIDAQLDQYKKEQVASESEKREIQKSNHADMQSIAKPMFDALSVEQIKKYANKAGIKPSEAKKELKSMAYWQPQKAVKIFEALKAAKADQDKLAIQTTSPVIQSMDVEIQTAQEQLASTKSVAQKIKIQKKITELQNTRAAHEAATSPHNDLPEPTQAQIEAGNYKKGHIKVHGLNIAVENPRGSERRGTDPDGKEWAHTMSDHYGYLKLTIGADNENIDTYVGRNPESNQVFIVNQIEQQSGGFDEHKVMLGFDSQEDAIKAYKSNFDKGWKVGPVHTMSKDEFKIWLKDGDTKKPAGATLTNKGTKTAAQEQNVNDLEAKIAELDAKINAEPHPKLLERAALRKQRDELIKQRQMEAPSMEKPSVQESQKLTADEKTIQDLDRLYKNASIQDLEKSLERLDRDIQKQHEASIGEVTNGKRSTRKAVAAGARDRFLKDRLDLDKYIKYRKSTESVFEQIQSDSGLTHSIPSKLMDQVHKLDDVVSDLASMKTEGVKTNVLYGNQLLAKIAKLNPNVQVHIVSDLNNIQDKATQARLSSGGFYIPDQNILYIYPQSDIWEGSALELLNHELIHTVTEQSITANRVSRENLDKLEEFRSILGEYIWNQGENLDANMAERLRYAYEQDFPHELLAVSTSETNVREVFKAMLGQNGFNQLNAIFTEISTNQFKEKIDDRLSTRGQGQQPSRDRAENLSTSDTRTKNSDGANAESSDGIASSTSNKSSGTQNSSTRTSQADIPNGTNSNNRFKGVLEDSGRDHGKTLERISEEDKQLKKNNENKRFSRAENRVQSSTIEQVREALVKRFGEKTIADLEAQGVLNIVQNQQDGMTGNVEGWYENGKVTLVASNLDADSAVATFLHELGGHGGFQNLMNKDAYADLMRQFERMVEQGNPVAIEAKRLAERELNKNVQLDEYLPYMITLASQMQLKNVAQKGAIKRFMDRIVSAVKAWLYDKGIQLNINESDVLALAERMVAAQSGITAVQRVKQQLQNTSTWMKAPNSNPTRLTEQQWLQVRTPAFKRWFGDWENNPVQASQAIDENGEPKIYYHGTAAEFNKFNRGGGLLGRGVYLTDDLATAQMYGDVKSNNNGIVMPLFVNTKQAMQATDRTSRAQIDRASASGRFDGIRHSFQDMDFLVAFNPNQVKHAMNNEGSFDGQNDDIRFSRSSNYSDITNRIVNGFKNLPKVAENKGKDWLKIGLQALTRRQLTEIYSKILPPLKKYNELAAQMDADKNDAGAEADNIVREWSKLKDENQLADLMHDATLAKIDAAKPYQSGDDRAKYTQLSNRFKQLSPEAQAMYTKARDAYKKHYANVHQAIKERILRSELSSQKKADLLKKMDDNFFNGYIKGVYFPLARFGEYVVVVRNQSNQVESVSRAETMGEAESVRSELMKKYPLSKVDPVKLDKEFNASRDGVGRGFMSSLFDEVDNLGLSTAEQAEFEDTLSQLYLSSMPDLSWVKHGIHRKGTAGFSQDARRAFAQNMFSGANYLAKLRYGDQLVEQLDKMQKHADEQFKNNIHYDQRSAQRVIGEMNKRHDNLMNPKGHPLSSFLTSVGFMYYMGLSPASAIVNLSQTALVAYPIMGAKWGYDKAGKELLKASKDFAEGVEFKVPDFSSLESFKNSIGDVYSPNIDKVIRGLELNAYNKAVSRGVIDVTQAHDLAGIAQGEDSKVMWYFRPAMRLASGMFHHAERFNREVTFIAAYRLATQAGANHETAFEQAIDAVYKGHFDYSAGNRARFMQSNPAKVILLFKQYAQNMLYTLLRNAHQSIYALDPKDQREARRALAGILGMHALAAGAIGLPITGMLATASILIAKKSKLGAAAFGVAALAALASGGDDDDPYELENVIRNWLADIHPKFADLVFGGAPRAFSPVDLSGRVGLNNLIIPDVQDGIEGADWSNAYAAALLGPVAGIGTNMAKGMQLMGEGHYRRGLESMLPVVIRNPIKAWRYADEGVLAKDGKVIQGDVGGVGIFSQAIGFSPSDVRTSMEGRSAINAYRNKLNNGRNNLMDAWVNARREDNGQSMEDAWTAILEYNQKVGQKNPSLRINRIQLMQRYKERERKNKDAGDGGVYLTKRERGAEEQGRFAFGD